jgi:hypothetical protein
VYDALDSIDEWKNDTLVQLALSTLDYLPVLEIRGNCEDTHYSPALIEKRHDARFEQGLLTAMGNDWGEPDWYTTPAHSFLKDNGPNATIGIVVRTPYARS